MSDTRKDYDPEIEKKFPDEPKQEAPEKEDIGNLDEDAKGGKDNDH